VIEPGGVVMDELAPGFGVSMQFPLLFFVQRVDFPL
jgi:hypothetical protein